jgi:hypothetical protein
VHLNNFTCTAAYFALDFDPIRFRLFFAHITPLNIANVPESNCFAYLLLYGGQLVAHHTILRFWIFAFHPLCAASISRKEAEV